MDKILGIELEYIRSITSSTSGTTHTISVHYYKNGKVGTVSFAAHNLKDKKVRFDKYKKELKDYREKTNNN